MKLPNTARLLALRAENANAGDVMAKLAPRFRRLEARHEEGTAPRAVSAYQLFQTPPEVASQLVGLLELRPGARVLEPSAGLGRLLDALPDGCEVTAVEMADAVAAELRRQQRPNVTLHHRDFLAMKPEEIGDDGFDAIVMNPPFHMRDDIRHIQHAMKFLARGGVLAALCLATDHREKALRHLAETWERLPEGTFRSAGTSVATFMLTIREDV